MSRSKRIKNAYTKAIGKDWYKKMLAAKLAKADKAKRDKLGPLDNNSKTKPDLPSTPPNKRLEVTEPTQGSKMEEHTSSSNAIEKALQRLEQQARGL